MLIIANKTLTIRQCCLHQGKYVSSHMLRTHIFSLMKAALPKHWTFIRNYQRLTHHLPTFNTHKRYAGTLYLQREFLQGEKVIEIKILKPSTQLSLALEKHLTLPPPTPQQIWIHKRKAFFVFSLDEEESQ